jgi:hypothetical protein
MKELLMSHTDTLFLPTMLAVVLSTTLFVMSMAFIVIPYAMGGHPGEPRVPAAQNGQFHPT